MAPEARCVTVREGEVGSDGSFIKIYQGMTLPASTDTDAWNLWSAICVGYRESPDWGEFKKNWVPPVGIRRYRFAAMPHIVTEVCIVNVQGG